MRTQRVFEQTASRLLFVVIVFLVTALWKSDVFATVRERVTHIFPQESHSELPTRSNKVPSPNDSSISAQESFPSEPENVRNIFASSTYLYTVQDVIDGDTIRIAVPHSSTGTELVRFVGIDAPEIPLPHKVGECYGTEATQHLRSLLSKTRVRLEFDTTQGVRDRHGRLLAYVLYEGLNVNEWLVRRGDAREYTYAKPYRYQTSFKTAQEAAQAEKRGMWTCME
jgi:endonuclease YncB( thermonuclease family)